MCATVETLTLFDSQCSRAHNLSKCGSLIAIDGCNESEVVNESGVNEMHGMDCLNACLPAYISWNENVRLKVEKFHLAISGLWLED